MAPKKRNSIPKETAAEVMFLSHRTCCVCYESEKILQIHHIDEDPSNNSIENLSVLCIDCHNKTMIKGGIGRKLDSHQIIRFRNDWIERVKTKRTNIEKDLSIKTVTSQNDSIEDNLDYITYDDPNLLKDYLDKVLKIHDAHLIISQDKWDQGYTNNINEGIFDMIDFYEMVLVKLSSFYTKDHFGDSTPAVYFRDIISSKFSWQWLVLDPHNPGIVDYSANIMFELKEMVVQMANSLINTYDLNKDNYFNKWSEIWMHTKHNS